MKKTDASFYPNLRRKWPSNRSKKKTELAKRFEVNPNQISQWKREFLDNAYKALESGDKNTAKGPDVQGLFQQIVQVKGENDF
jgi:transposase-like protein